MAGNTDLVKQAMKLTDDGGDLLGEVARVHGDSRPASGFVNRACTGRTLGERIDGFQDVQSRPSRSVGGERLITEGCTCCK
jgi:hypothetical protein